MKRFEGGFCTAIVALLCGGCGAGPLPTDESSGETVAGDTVAGDTVVETPEVLQTPTKGRPPLDYGNVMSPSPSPSPVWARAATGRNFSDLGLPVKALSGRVTVGKPIVRRTLNDATAVHSLAEISAQTFDQLDTVEIGWIVYDDDPNPRLFVFNWIRTGPDAMGNWSTFPICNPSGSPHYRCSAFQSTHSTIKPDMVMSAGTTVTLGLKHVDTGSTAGWHFLYNGTDFGYLADIGWGNRFKGVGVAQWFGEVSGTSAALCSEMGNGKWASDSTSASFSIIQYALQGQPLANATDLNRWDVNDPSRYTGIFGGTLWRAPFRFGGPYFSTSPNCPSLGGCKKKLCCGAMICETQSCPVICPPPDQ